MLNESIANILREIGMYLEMENVPFKPRAYEKAAQGIESLEEDVGDLYRTGGLKRLKEIPGVGEAIAEKIEEFVTTGKVRVHQEYKRKMPIRLGELTGIEGVGVKVAFKLYRKLGVKNLDDLEKAAHAGRIAKLPGFGAKSEENILKGIAFVRQGASRFVLGFVQPTVEEIEGRLKALDGVSRIVIAGSYRRRKETVGDIDILVVSRRPKPIMDFFVSMPEVARVYAHGDTKSAVKLKTGLDVDLRVVPERSFGAALNYFTGSKSHNVALREIAVKKGYKLNEYGLFRLGRDGAEIFLAGRTEEELYKALGLRYIEPELREDTGEIAAAARNALPRLIGYGDLKGDLQVQTDWTDGKNSLEEMVSAAEHAGLEYIAITDHTKYLAMTGGLGENRLLDQMRAIDRLNTKLKGRKSAFRVLKGAEINILKDGELDINNNVLARLEWAGAAIHSNFNLSKTDQTKRIVNALRNPHVDCIFHLTTRIINRRPPIELDLDAVFAEAKKQGKVLEIDAFPDRLDIRDDLVRRAVHMGIKLSVDSDAHHVSHFQYLRYGIAQARRGWAEKSDVINTLPVEKLLRHIAR